MADSEQSKSGPICVRCGNAGIKQIVGPFETMGQMVIFDLNDGGRIHIPRQNIAAMWNDEQIRRGSRILETKTKPGTSL